MTRAEEIMDRMQFHSEEDFVNYELRMNKLQHKESEIVTTLKDIDYTGLKVLSFDGMNKLDTFHLRRLNLTTIPYQDNSKYWYCRKGNTVYDQYGMQLADNYSVVKLYADGYVFSITVLYLIVKSIKFGYNYCCAVKTDRVTPCPSQQLVMELITDVDNIHNQLVGITTEGLYNPAHLVQNLLK